jgi:SAM-dependent methyltransferase
VDPLARAGFGADEQAALTYERGRPGYAPELAPWLVTQLGLTRASRVLDLAAGTGQLSRMLVGRVGSIVAVEPAAAMRAVLAVAVPRAEVLEGVAERLPLPNASVDAAVVGNAFHWFDGPRAVAELARVLKPGGGLAVVWNIGRESDPAAPELEAFVATERERAGVTDAKRSAWRVALDASERFEPLGECELHHRRTQDRDTFTDYLASLAFVAALPDRDAVVARIRSLCPDASELLLRTDCHLWRSRGPRSRGGSPPRNVARGGESAERLSARERAGAPGT